MTTAFVLPGGGSLGALQVGMAEALIDAGIVPELLVGTSAGAVNAAWLAAHPDPAGVAELRRQWLSVRRQEVFPFSPLSIALGLLGRRDYVVKAAPLARWLSARLPFDRLEAAPVPLHVMATDLVTGAPVQLSSGDLIEALLASTALPGIFPPVRIDGRLLVDGGIAADTPITQAVDLGADTVYVLPTVSFSSDGQPSGAFDVALQAIAHLLGNASDSELQANAARCKLYVVPAAPTADLSPFNFRRTRELMDTAREMARQWLPISTPIQPLSVAEGDDLVTDNVS
jgi:NTE family protein